MKTIQRCVGILLFLGFACPVFSQNYYAELNGSNKYVQLGNVPIDTAYTIEMWFNTANPSNYSQLLSKGFLSYLAANNTLNGRFFAATQAVFAANKWYHVAVSYGGRGTKETLYVDGNLIQESAIITTLTTKDSLLPVQVGLYQSTSRPLSGGVDEVRIWNYVRTAADIKANANKRLCGRETGLIGYWDFNEGSGTLVKDYSNNNNTGLLVNNTGYKLAPIDIFPSRLDTGKVQVDILSSSFQVGQTDIRLSIGNGKNTAVVNPVVEWELDGVRQTPFYRTVTLQPYCTTLTTDTVKIGSLNLKAGKKYSVKAWVSELNGTPLSIVDTFIRELSPRLRDTLTIGGINPDFFTFTEAATALQNVGVSGKVVFKVRNGVYNESVTINTILGVDSLKTITFQSESGDSSTVILRSTSVAALTLNNADWMTFKSIRMEVVNSPRYAFSLITKNSTFSNCEFVMVSTQNAINDNITQTGERCVFQNNKIINGDYGILSSSNELKIINNIFQTQRSLSITTSGLNCIISGNQCTGRINFSGSKSIIEKNRIVSSTISGTAMTLGGDNTVRNNFIQLSTSTANTTLGGMAIDALGVVENNFIHLTSTVSTVTLSGLSVNDKSTIQNNTVVINSPSSNSRAATLTGDSIRLYNNILYCSNKGYPIQVSSIPTGFLSDYNDYFSAENKISGGSSNALQVASLEDWQNLTKTDKRSINVNPYFVGNTYSATHVALIDGQNTGIATDIENKPRQNRPDIGCFELTSFPVLDAGVVKIVLPQKPIKTGKHPLSIIVQNMGSTPLTQATINWTVNGVVQSPKSWTGNLAFKDSAIVVLDSVTIGNQATAIKSWTSRPNNGTDTYPINDTSAVTNILSGLAGTYTIGGLNPNFINFTRAIERLHNSGVSDSVTFLVRNGTYREELQINKIQGVDSTNKIVFKSELGLIDSVVLAQPVANGSNFSYISFSNTSWITWQNFTFSPNLYVRLQVGNGSHHLFFKNNVFNEEVLIDEGVNDLYFNENVFNGDFRANGTLLLPLKNITFQKNTVDSYMSIGNAQNVNVKNNKFISTGLIVNGITKDVIIYGNNITTRDYGDGIRLSDSCVNCDVINNYIRLENTPRYYGIYTTGGNNQNFLYNTIFSSNYGSGVGFYSNKGTNKKLYNNIFCTVNPIYINDSLSISASDYNNFYGTGDTAIGFFNYSRNFTRIKTLADWQTRTGFDQHSLAVKPYFTADTSFRVIQPLLDKTGIPIAGITTDIEGQTRDALRPDIGADEFVVTDDLVLDSIVSLKNITCRFSDSLFASLRILNSSLTTKTGFTVGYSINNAPVYLENVDTFSIASGQAKVYTIKKPIVVTTNQDSLSIKAFVSLATDNNRANDTLLNAKVTLLKAVGDVLNLKPIAGSTQVGSLNSFGDISMDFTWDSTRNATSYDLYLWFPDTAPRSATPYRSGFTSNFQKNVLLFANNLKRKWQVVAKNTCSQKESPALTFNAIRAADLAVDSVQTPINMVAGQNVQFSWRVRNLSPTPTGLYKWTDYFYITKDSLGLTATEFSGTKPNFSALSQGEGYINSATFTLPATLNGDYYVTVRAATTSNDDDDYSNNKFVKKITISQLPPPDLRIQNIVVTPQSTFSGNQIQVNWTVANRGATSTLVGNWRDSLYLRNTNDNSFTKSVVLGTLTNNKVLLPDSAVSLTGSFRVSDTLPNGRYFVHIKTDATNIINEKVFEDNNTAVSDSIAIIQPPRPDLVVLPLSIADSVSTGQSVVLRWAVVNNAAPMSAATRWTDQVFFTNTPTLGSNAILLGSWNRLKNLGNEERDTVQVTFTIPTNVFGSYYLHIKTDVNNTVFEYLNENNNIYSKPIQILSPDMIVTQMNPNPSIGLSGRVVTVNYTVKNIGQGAWNTNLRDRLYLSTTATITAASTQVATIIQNVSVSKDSSTNRSLSFTIPNGISGNYYLILKTDSDNAVFESGNTGENNNTTAQLYYIDLSPSPDLQVTAINTPNLGNTIAYLPVSFTVKNTGTGQISTPSVWRDRIYVSADTAFNISKSILLKEWVRTDSLSSDAAYSTIDSVLLTNQMLRNLNVFTDKNLYLYVFTDALDNIFEINIANTNNISRSKPIFIDVPNLSDLALTAVNSLPDTVIAGTSYPIGYTVTNFGVPTAVWNVSSWNDGVYFSPSVRLDSAFTLNFLNGFSGNLLTNESYTKTANVFIPSNLSGKYYLTVKADYLNLVPDNDTTNDTKSLRFDSVQNRIIPIFIKSFPLPDLQPQRLDFTNPLATGITQTARWTVRNGGIAATFSAWVDKLYLSADATLNERTDYLITSVTNSKVLKIDSTYSDTVSFALPSNFNGNYYLILKTNANDYIAESNKNNNVFIAPVIISQPPPSDLIVTGVTAPDTLRFGKKITIKWQLKNQGTAPAIGTVKDAVYLSKDTIYSSDDILFAITEGGVNIASNVSVSRSVDNFVTDASEGLYYALIRTDLQNNINETNEINNTKTSTNQLLLNIPTLTLDNQVRDTLPNNVPLYYRIDVPANLVGETMLVNLSGDIFNGNNELFIRYGGLPTRSVQDFSHTNPFLGKQDVIIPVLKQGTYYILLYGKSNTATFQPITVEARIIPFTILSANTSIGGNTGTITTKISGAKFSENMTATLKRGAVTIEATSVFYINSASVFASFNLVGRDTGLYAVILKKQTGETSTLNNGFRIIKPNTLGGGSTTGGFFCSIVTSEEGTNSSLSTTISHPSSTRPNNLVPITLEFGNSGLSDIPVPTRTLASTAGAPLALNIANLSANLQELFMVFKETDGPPNVLRPGAVGRITVYTKAVKPLRFLLKE